jgi:hypothetical protein
MIINDEGYTITGVPGIEYIKIQPRDDGGAVLITKDEAAQYARTWEIDKAEQFQLALERAVELARAVVAQNVRAGS